MGLRWFIRILLLGALLNMAILSVVASSVGADAKTRAIVSMAWGLFLLWVVIGGALMLRFREQFRRWVLGVSINWQIKFVVFATVLALVEELIATAMTNLAPVFGASTGEAYITASANYFEVILFHSVIVFIPMFIAWAWLLNRYDFSSNAVFILFGITGTLSEWIAFGIGTPISFAFWSFIYGLMIYLPAYSLPANRAVRVPRLQHAIWAVIFPILCSVPVAIIVNLLNQSSGKVA
jgi:hypothetical protein